MNIEGDTSRFAQLEQFNLNVSISFVIRVNLPHPCSFMTDPPSSDKSFRDYLPINVPSCSFAFDSVLPSAIELEIMLTPTKKSHGLYSYSARLLKCSRHIISAPLANLINNSVQRGIFPSKLKHAKVTPIFKDGDEAEPGNYRPISLLSVFNRLFEKVIYNRLKSFLANIVYFTGSVRFPKTALNRARNPGYREQNSIKHGQGNVLLWCIYLPSRSI